MAEKKGRTMSFNLVSSARTSTGTRTNVRRLGIPRLEKERGRKKGSEKVSGKRSSDGGKHGEGPREKGRKRRAHQVEGRARPKGVGCRFLPRATYALEEREEERGNEGIDEMSMGNAGRTEGRAERAHLERLG